MNASVQYSIEVRRALGRVQEHVRNSSGCRKLGLHRVDVLRVLEYVGTLERHIAPAPGDAPQHLGDWAHPSIRDPVERSGALSTQGQASGSPNPAGQDPYAEVLRVTSIGALVDRAAVVSTSNEPDPEPVRRACDAIARAGGAVMGEGQVTCRVTNSMSPMPAGSRSTVETRFLDGVMVKLNGIPVWVSGVASTHPNNWTLVGEYQADPDCHHASVPRDGDFARVSYALGSERTRTRIRQVLYDHADAVDRYRLGRSAAVLRGEATEAILNIIREEMENAGK